MANLLGQVTIPASGIISLSAGIQQPMGGAGNVVGQPPVGNIFFQQLLVQNNNGSGNIRLGDWSVSSTRGILLIPTASGNFGALINYGSYLSDWFVEGASGAVVDFLYIQ